jgi:NADH-quinone oxidoreductase subunit N
VDANLVSALTAYLPPIVAEAVLGIAACVLFVGASFKGGRARWGVAALVSLGLAGAALAWTVAFVPTLDALERERAALEREALAQNEKAVKARTPEDRKAAVEEAKKLKDDAAALQARIAAQVYASPLLHTSFGVLVTLLALGGGVVLVLLSWHEAPDAYAGEFHGCLLLLVAGTALVGLANDLVTLFLALELVSIPTYVMLYLPRTDAPAQEAAVKYFLLSIFSSALLLFGFSYLYGVTGTTNLPALAEVLRGPFEDKVLANLAAPPRAPALPKMALVALLMVVAGLGFNMTAVPFHFYAPDVYQGTATSLAALLSYIPKVAGFVALMRLLGMPGLLGYTAASEAPLLPLYPINVGPQLPLLLYIIAAVTMTLGTVLALLQDNLKRLLAYSGVAHAGYLLIGVAVAPRLPGGEGVLAGGYESVMFYLVAYGAMTVGVFAVLSYLSTDKKPVETVNDLAGLGRTHPGVALLMVVFLFSLIGVPATAGFWGKAFLFSTALSVPDDPQHLYLWLAVIGAINAAIGAWYYLRIATVMYLRDALHPLPRPRSWPVLASIWLCALITLAVGLYPNPLKEGVKAAVTPGAVAAAPAAGAPVADAGR